MGCDPIKLELHYVVLLFLVRVSAHTPRWTVSVTLAVFALGGLRCGGELPGRTVVPVHVHPICDAVGLLRDPLCDVSVPLYLGRTLYDIACGRMFYLYYRACAHGTVGRRFREGESRPEWFRMVR